MTSPPDGARVLVLCPFAPDPLSPHGGGKVCGQFLTELSGRARVGLLCVRGDGQPGVPAGLSRRLEFAVEVAGAARGSSTPARIVNAGRDRAGLLMGRPLWATHVRGREFAATLDRLVADWRPDIIQAEFSVMGQYLSKKKWPDIPQILVEHDPGSAEDRRLAGAGREHPSLLRYLEARAWRRFRRLVVRAPEGIVAFTDADRVLVQARMPFPERCVVISPGFWLPEGAMNPAGTDPPRILFVGGFTHPPNADAARRLVSGIFPSVRRAVQDCRLQIAGGSPPPDLKALAGEGVEMLGFVPDLSRLVDEAAVIAVPVRSGGGIRVKVMESLSDGKALVASARAVAGLPLVPGRDFVAAESDEEFADALVRLVQDRPGRTTLGRQARQWAEANLSWETPIDDYDALYRRLIGTRGLAR